MHRASEKKEPPLVEDDAHRCEACGRAVRAGGLQSCTAMERSRVFKGRRKPGEADRGLYETFEAPREVGVCEACAARIVAGESLHALRARRVNRQMLMFAALLVLIAMLTPILLPYVRTALWLNR